MQKFKQFLIGFIRVLPFFVWGVLVLMCIAYRKQFSLETVLNYAPDSLIFGAAALIFAYAVKSLAIFFPLIILNIAGGILFSPLSALVINTVGVGVMTALPYFVGRFCGKMYLDTLTKKYPKIAEFIDRPKDFFFQSFFLRIISCLPGDVVSIYFGAVGAPFGVYFVGSMLGIMPGVVTATFMGTSILDPASPVFVWSVVSTVVLAAGSAAVHYFGKKKKE